MLEVGHVALPWDHSAPNLPALMPITCPIQFKTPSEDEFRQLDYVVMHHVFASHNQLGRFCDEEIHQVDLAHRLQMAGLQPIARETPVTVSWQTFRKTYYLDLVVRDAVIYELKAVSSLTGEHKAQLLNYLMLLGQPRGKLINFRTSAAEWHFVSTTLTAEERRDVSIHDARWRQLTPRCKLLRATLTDLLADWGAFLEIRLYQEALAFLLGDDTAVMKRVKLSRSDLDLGDQQLHILAPTSLSDSPGSPNTRPLRITPASLAGADAAARHAMDQPQPPKNRTCDSHSRMIEKGT